MPVLWTIWQPSKKVGVGKYQLVNIKIVFSLIKVDLQEQKVKVGLMLEMVNRRDPADSWYKSGQCEIDCYGRIPGIV